MRIKLWTRGRIVSAARAILAERGIRGLTMRAVAADANVTATAIYRHFRNKQALIDEVVKTGFVEMDVWMMKGHKAKTLKRGLWVMFDNVRSYAQKHPRLFELMMRPGSKDSPPWERLAYLLQQCMRARVIDYGNAETLGRLLWCQMRGTLSHGHRLGERPLRVMYDASLRTLLKSAT
jgi:AcrR family transcriptional regulator